ncbi:MAG: hypothetical protein RI915_1519, partial [Pseudomonadota bacterium]
MKKTWVAVGASLAVLGAGWVGASVLVGMKTQEALKGLMVQDSSLKASPWRVSQVTQERGLFQSKGQLALVLSPDCQAQDEEDLTFQVTYTLDHLPLPSGLARFSWQLAPEGEDAQVFKSLFGSASALKGQGVVGLGGAVRSSLNLPAVAMRRSGEVLEISPTTGQFAIDGQKLALETKIDRLVVRGKGEALSIQGLAMDFEVDDLRIGTGSGSFKVAQASTTLGSLEGLELRMEAKEKGDRMDMSVTPSVRKLEAAGQTLTDLRMQWAWNGLHTESVESLIKLFDSSCGVQALTAQENKVAAQALRTLLVKGFSVGMPTLTGKTDTGRLEGSLWVELQAAKGNEPSLVEQLKSQGKLEVEGSFITPDQREMAVATGFAVKQGNALSATYDYAQGLLKVNNRSMDARIFEEMLQQTDQQLRLALDSMQK